MFSHDIVSWNLEVIALQYMKVRCICKLPGDSVILGQVWFNPCTFGNVIFLSAMSFVQRFGRDISPLYFSVFIITFL